METPMVTTQEDGFVDMGRLQGNMAWWGLWLLRSKQATTAQLQPSGIMREHSSGMVRSFPFSKEAVNVILT